MVARALATVIGSFLGLLQGSHKLDSLLAFLMRRPYSIPVGLNLAAMGGQCLLCGYPGQLQPYSHIQLLVAGCPNIYLKALNFGWPLPESFKHSNVDISQGPGVHFHDSLRFCTSSTLLLFLYRTRCRATVLAQHHHMNMPLATVMRALFTRGALGHPPTPCLAQCLVTPSASWTWICPTSGNSCKTLEGKKPSTNSGSWCQRHGMACRLMMWCPSQCLSQLPIGQQSV